MRHMQIGIVHYSYILDLVGTFQQTLTNVAVEVAVPGQVTKNIL